MRDIIQTVLFIIGLIVVSLLVDKDIELEKKLTKLEVENYNRSVEMIDLKKTIQEYQNQTERILDTNMKLITEGGWK